MATRHGPEAVAAITCPVLLVVGDRDPLFPPASIRATAELLADARIVELPGCGHSPYFEDPEAWNLVVGRFLAGLAA
jgi:3-oxoadipate enol-lactonase